MSTCQERDVGRSCKNDRMRRHFDNHGRVQVAQIRRGQRIRKSRSVFHLITSTTTSNMKDLISRSRSSSIASDQNEPENFRGCHSLNDSGR